MENLRQALSTRPQPPTPVYTLQELASKLHMSVNEILEGAPDEGLPTDPREYLSTEQARVLIKAFGPLDNPGGNTEARVHGGA